MTTHAYFLTVLIFLLALVTGPIASALTGWRQRVNAETEKLKAEAESIKNPYARELATGFVNEVPWALDKATQALSESRNHVVEEVSRVNPQAGGIVGTLIDAALATPPLPLLPTAAVPVTASHPVPPATSQPDPVSLDALPVSEAPVLDPTPGAVATEVMPNGSVRETMVASDGSTWQRVNPK
jgi:hypothetical protein